MARITDLIVRNYRSISEAHLKFPKSAPLILVGENNAGKSNLVKALHLTLGPFWPGTHEPEDHEFFQRDRSNPIEIEIAFAADDLFGGRYEKVVWRYDNTSEQPGYFRGMPGPRGQTDGWINNDDRDSCMCVVIEADRNLHYHLGYSSKWTLLSRLMTKFHKCLENQEDVRDELEELFNQIKSKFHEIPEFAEFVTGLQSHMSDLVSTMTHKLEVDFEAYNPINFFHALRLQAAEGAAARALEEMGTGEQQILAMAFGHAYAKAFHTGILMIIEEPESHLHPLAQQWLAKRLASMSSEGVQLVLTTHSADFIDILNLGGLALISKEDSGTTATQISTKQLVQHCVSLGSDPQKIRVGNVLPFYRANATKELLEGFFAKLVFLVEGPTESLSLPVYLEKIGLDCSKEGIAVLPVHGKGNLAKWRRLFDAFGIATYIAFDNDGKKDDRQGEKRRDALVSVGLSDADERQSVIESEEVLISDNYIVFGSNFEFVLRSSFEDYEELEEEAAAEGIESKPFLARSVAERLELDEDEEGWQLMQHLAEKLRQLL